MFWFEYNFLYVLAADGKAEIGLGRSFSSRLSTSAAILFDQRRRKIALCSGGGPPYIIFLAQNTGLATAEICQSAMQRLSGYRQFSEPVSSDGFRHSEFGL